MSEDLLNEVISNIIESADEVKSSGTANDLNYGKLLAYAEALSIIRDIYAGDLSKIGLDFDIDKRYLTT